MGNINDEIYYFAWVIAYDFNLKDIAYKYNITECDTLYDFSNYVANKFVKSDEYKDIKRSSYEMFYKFIDNNKGLEELFKYYFNITKKRLNDEEKKEVVVIYQESDLLETILYCGEKGYITKEEERELIDNCRYNPYPNEDNYWEYKIDYIYKFFDLLNITDEEFKKFSLEYEKEINND